ncbi:azurin [Uliginosibacterium sp. H1]|uniref:azurin n=1 Tax=Uliginosibacterium sp. H1 TaxID=3114757 RepID=UPI002E16C847|nr:azurin [Uliginosibacterium sp. H1]
MSSIRKLMIAAVCASAAAPLWAQQCNLTVESNDAMQFNTKAITVPKACKQFTVELVHTGKLPRNAMGHNWVLTKTADVQAVASDGMSAGVDKGFLKPGDARVIATTKLIGGGERDKVAVDVAKLKAGEAYTFFCSFPGHSSIMKGTLSLGS